MARINLLPWREKLRKERQQQFFIIIGVAAVASLVIIALIHNEVGGRIDTQEQRNTFLNQQIAIVDSQIQTIKSLEDEKARLLNRMTVIQQLQASRPDIVHLFEEIVTTVPEGTRLVKVSRTNNEILVEGVADSNALISSFMRNIDKSTMLAEPELIVIDSSRKEYPNASWFSLRFKQKHTNVSLAGR